MSVSRLSRRREFWSKDNVDRLLPAPAFGRFGLGVHRFEKVLKFLRFGNEALNVQEDALFQGKEFINLMHSKIEKSIHPGYKLTADESMFAWYGKEEFENGMPNLMKIKRKPKGVGCEVKTLCDSRSKIMLRLEINEGKDKMATKEGRVEYGAGASTLLRLTRPYRGTGRIILADAWFASLKATKALLDHGLFFIGKIWVLLFNI